MAILQIHKVTISIARLLPVPVHQPVGSTTVRYSSTVIIMTAIIIWHKAVAVAVVVAAALVVVIVLMVLFSLLLLSLLVILAISIAMIAVIIAAAVVALTIPITTVPTAISSSIATTSTPVSIPIPVARRRPVVVLVAAAKCRRYPFVCRLRPHHRKGQTHPTVLRLLVGWGRVRAAINDFIKKYSNN